MCGPHDYFSHSVECLVLTILRLASHVLVASLMLVWTAADPSITTGNRTNEAAVNFSTGDNGNEDVAVKFSTVPFL